MRAGDDDDDLAGLGLVRHCLRWTWVCATYIQDSLDTHCQGHPRHLGQVVAEEARVGKYRVIGKGLHTCTRFEAGARLVEGDVPIGTDTTKEQLDASDLIDLLFILVALGLQVGGITIEDVDVARFHVDMREEMLIHEAVVAFRVVSRDPDVFVLAVSDPSTIHVPGLHKGSKGEQNI